MRFRVEGHDGPSPAGNATLYVDETVAGALQIKIQPGHFSLAGEGINASRDAGQPVSSQYTTPYELTGGTLHEVVLERTDDPSSTRNYISPPGSHETRNSEAASACIHPLG